MQNRWKADPHVTLCFIVSLALVLGTLWACTFTNVTAFPDIRYIDPFSYCRGVDTIDKPDDSYVGPAVPPAVLEGLARALGVPRVEPRGVFWRCMDRRVYACAVGANLPCEEKADTSREPTRAMLDFCRSQPGADTIPMAVTGHAALFEWRCQGTQPAIIRTITEPDSRGFLANIWHEIRE